MFGVRVIPGIDVDRARWRNTLAWRALDELTVGVEYDPLADDVGPIANWRAVDETADWPALILGTSSDRIGTPEGRSYYATLSKDLEHRTGLPVAPYAGVSYGEFDDELVGIGGLSIRWTDEISSMHLWDGHNLHHVIERAYGRGSFGLVLVDLDGRWSVGMSYSVGFSMPWE